MLDPIVIVRCQLSVSGDQKKRQLKGYIIVRYIIKRYFNGVPAGKDQNHDYLVH